MSKFKIYVGKKEPSFQVKSLEKEIHPADQVLLVKEMIKKDEPLSFYSCSPDFVSAFKYLTKEGEVEFFLDEISTGTNIEPLFASFNESLDLISKFAINSEYYQ